MSRVIGALVGALGLLLGMAPAAGAAPVGQLDRNLAQLWTSVFETPGAQNSFGTGGQDFACWDLDGTVAPFDPVQVDSCTVGTGRWLFVTAASFECSTLEGNGTTETELRTCARQKDQQIAPLVTVDGRPVRVSEAETPLLDVVVPTDHLTGVPSGAGQLVAHGWVVLVHPLSVGSHTVKISDTIATEIVVQAGH
jgi:hypothetical protein